MIAALLSLSLLASAAPPAPAHPAAPSNPTSPGGPSASRAPTTESALFIDMRGFRNDSGEALVALFSSALGFPDHPDRAIRWVVVPIHNRRARAVIRGVAPGTYAIAVLHDEDGNRKMKTGWMGIPKEGFGVSRDARGHFGPPHFKDARFTLGPHQNATVVIHLIYY